MRTGRLLTLSALLAALLLASPAAAFAHECHHHGEAKAAATWKCPSCGFASNTGNFCSKCGTAKPGTWTCPSCGHRGNTGKFCPNCGTAKPAPNAPVAQASSTPAKPADNGLCINVLRTNGSVDQYKLADMPSISFSGNRISVGGVSYEKSKVQRLEYGRSVASPQATSDKPADQQNAVYFYRHDGRFNAFEQTAIKSMSHDIADTLQVALADSVYKIPIAAIDSIGIHPFPTVYNPRVVRLAPYIPYVESVSAENQSIKFKKNLPDGMKPRQGDILFYETFDTTFPDGFAGRVVTTDGYACSTEMVGLDDIYERVIMFGTLSAANGLSASESGSSHLPAPDDMKDEVPKSGLSIDLKDMKLSVSRGSASASLDLDISPDFIVSVVKNGKYDFALISVDIKLDASAEVTFKVSHSIKLADFLGPSITPVAKFVIPACPVFSVGLDLHPFIDAALNGSISESARFSSRFAASITYRDGDVSFRPQVKADMSAGTPDVQAEGKVHVGALILPSIQITGGFWKVGPAFKLGPSATVTLDVDPSGAVNCAYDVLKDSKVSIAFEGNLEVDMRAFGRRVGATEMPELPFTIASKDWYFVPLFTKPTVAPTRKENVGVSTTASRDILLSVPIGIDILYGETPIKYYDGGSYSGETTIIRNHFSGFEEGATYTAVPTVDIFGVHVRAFPTTEFTIDKEEPEPKPEVQDTPEIQNPPVEEVKQDTKDPSGYRFEWKDSNGDNGYFERKDGVYLNYIFTRNYDSGMTYRYNDKEKTFAQKSDADPRWWVDDDIYGSNDNVMDASREYYRSYIKGRQEAEDEADGLWNVFSDDLGGIAYFEETFRRHYHQTFGLNNGEELLKKDYVGTGIICGVKCNVYDNHKRWPQQAKVWVDPKTGLCLRYELDDGYWFEVTSYRINDYDF